MPSFAELIQQGAGHAWLFVPSAILLGALHGLEPGHSKTMMAAFIIAIRGTVTQAVLLGLAATASHTLVVWGIALGGLYLWRDVASETFEPYFQLASAGVIIALALWMLWRTWRDQHPATEARHQSHDHGHHHDHHHDHDHARDHGHGAHHNHHHHDGPRDAVPFGSAGGTILAEADGHQDAHERAHAEDIRRRFTGREATTWQIVLFGLTGGLIPCPAAITVLLLCLQLKELTLGFALVLCFSIGLAITLVAVGAAAALSVRHATRRWSWFGEFARRAPYLSGGLIILVGLYVGYHGWAGLPAGG
ncbi:nickel/cobalt efflux transporter [Bosea sp. (in: a-proteobacteria)]|jgi:nickel/cobalt exporter|uniref:nickel/cobalt efflux transporter n=1 Tax=Bosea sp. (in: a-proteobacteria) TaxID=1871050 RepID=UPI0035629711